MREDDRATARGEESRQRKDGASAHPARGCSPFPREPSFPEFTAKQPRSTQGERKQNRTERMAGVAVWKREKATFVLSQVLTYVASIMLNAHTYQTFDCRWVLL